MSKEDEPLKRYPGHPANATRSPVPLIDALAGYLPLPGFEIEDGLVCMIGADILGTAAESLEPDGILPALLAFHAFSHDDQTFLFPALTSFSRTEPGPGPHTSEKDAYNAPDF